MKITIKQLRKIIKEQSLDFGKSRDSFMKPTVAGVGTPAAVGLQLFDQALDAGKNSTIAIKFVSDKMKAMEYDQADILRAIKAIKGSGEMSNLEDAINSDF